MLGGARRREGLIVIFRDFFASAGGAFNFAGGRGVRGAGGWAIILWGLGTFLMFPDFLGS